MDQGEYDECVEKEIKMTESSQEEKLRIYDADEIAKKLLKEKKPVFKKPVRLGDMIHILVEIWESNEELLDY